MKRTLIALLCTSLSISLFGQDSSQSKLASHSIDAAGIKLAEQRIAGGLRSGSMDSPGGIVVVYFTPKDRPPAKDHVERIRRIVQTTASFYEDELARHGFANRKINLRRDSDGKISIIDVEGKGKDYGKPDGQKIRDEIVPVLRKENIDPRQSVLLMFCNLMGYDAQVSKISHHSPYYGGGSYLSGNAWQCDSEILDPLRFNDLTPIRDGEYGKITIGLHNSIFIGGVIHELGHALSLPHCKQRSDEAVRGTALMGSGNRTFRQELRGEGRGTFLTQTHALRLAAHPAFNARVTGQLRHPPQLTWDKLQIDVASDNTIRVRGQVTAEVPVHAIVAYFDPVGRGDYDATTASAFPDDEGHFAFRSGSLQANSAGDLRLVTCHINGATTQRAMTYRVDATGRPDLSSIQLQLQLAPMIDQVRSGNPAAAAKQLDQIAADDANLKRVGQRVLDRFTTGKDVVRPASIDPASIPDTTTTIQLSSVKPTSAKVGWIRPTYDSIPDKEVLLSVGDDYFASGIYAHAPARHVYQIDQKWKRLRGQCGLQTGHGGKVDFEIAGDGKLLWNKARRWHRKGNTV
ncbi:NPCBM/NEW2 domain-containing protein [Neorhodopirellula lusitana]|uniref:NPCBM/NEW2 domain-containing protein n=1 Tax=Neorhodopirellula lusitana TaxID=445327 RepID=UPI00384CFE0F